MCKSGDLLRPGWPESRDLRTAVHWGVPRPMWYRGVGPVLAWRAALAAYKASSRWCAFCPGSGGHMFRPPVAAAAEADDGGERRCAPALRILVISLYFLLSFWVISAGALGQLFLRPLSSSLYPRMYGAKVVVCLY